VSEPDRDKPQPPNPDELPPYEWQEVVTDDKSVTSVMRVAGGYVYHTTIFGSPPAMTSVFVSAADTFGDVIEPPTQKPRPG
jgi:hypothetical protein